MTKPTKNESLTNERLGKRFKSQFDLVNYAIHLAVGVIKTGRQPRVKTTIKNTAYQILEEIATGKDILEEEESCAEQPVDPEVIREAELSTSSDDKQDVPVATG